MSQEKKESSIKGAPIRRAATGGIVGATVGYLSTPKNRKKLLDKVDKEALKNKGESIGTFTKDKLNSIKDSGKEKSSQAYESLKTSTPNLFKKDNKIDKSSDVKATELVQEHDDEKEMHETSKSDSAYEELKEDNRMLQNKLQSLENKISKLLEIKEGEEEVGSKSNSKNENKKEKDSVDSGEEERIQDVKKTKKSSAKQSSGTKRTTKTKKDETKNADEEDDTELESDDDTAS